MTTLQRLAFERAQTINAKIKYLLPKTWDKDQDHHDVEITVLELKTILEYLDEQESLMCALLEEEQRDGGGD